MNETLQHRYSMGIEWSDEDGVYVVSFPEWGNLAHTHGATYEEAVRHGQEVLELLAESTRHNLKCYRNHACTEGGPPAPDLCDFATTGRKASVCTLPLQQRMSRVYIRPPFSPRADVAKYRALHIFPTGG